MTFRHGTAAMRVLALAVTLAILAPLGLSAQTKPNVPVNVSDTRQLLSAIGPNKTIVLKKGVYKLSAGYDVKSAYVSWETAEDGKELALSGVENLIIRGADGVSIVTDTADAYILGLYKSKNVTFDNIDFVRDIDSDPDSGNLYIEASSSVTFDRCSISGPSYYALELWECSDVAFKRGEILGATSGVLSIVYSKGFTLASTRISDCEGYPLVYLEESDVIRFENSTIEKSSGGNLIEIYSELGYVDEVVFSGCAFKGDDFAYFLGSDIFPTTEGCTFQDSSFDEDWRDYSVAPLDDEYYYYGEGDAYPAYYEHYESGLGFRYPEDWELQENEGGERVGIFHPDGSSIALFSKTYDLPSGADVSRQARTLISEGNDAFARLLREQAGVALAIGSEGDPYDAGGFVAQDFGGSASNADGSKAFVKARFFINEGAVYVMLIMSQEEYYLEPGSELDSILWSVETSR
jgi:hypothetical protein